jgi:photosystem II stability/assembly factor-like uncharacterized protein
MKPVCRSSQFLVVLPAVLVMLLTDPTVVASQTKRQRGPVAVHPWKDDAALRDVAFVGTTVGWAVGDHATAWKSPDSGRSWELLNVPVPADCSLRSVCFMVRRLGGGQIAGTSQIAWIAGRGTKPFTRVGYGVLLKTTDAGKSWQILGEGSRLPPLEFVRFFGANEGIAIGEASAEFPTGVLITEDGGETWLAAPGVPTAGWHAAAFTEFHDGVAVGPRGRISLVAGTNVGPPRTGSGSLRAVRAVALSDGLTGWAVGDGALVLKTSNGGVTWEPPPRDLPTPLSMFTDFSAVATVNDSVWIAGKPGGSIWHSPDGGRTWSSHPTGQTVPIHALSFSTPTHGWATGALGMILRTEDGGQTWLAARGNSRRAALLAIHTRAEKIPFGMLAKYGGDAGLRSVAVVVPRRDLAEGTDLALERCLSDSVTTVGGSAASVGWRLPLALPEIDTDIDRLTAEWQRHTEGRLREVVISNLVASLRMWRPDLVVVEAPEPGNATARLIFDAVQQAVREAADSTSMIEQSELAGLSPWKVSRIVTDGWYAPADEAQTLPRSSEVSVEPYEILRRHAVPVEILAGSGRAKLIDGPLANPQTERFWPLESKTDQFTLVAVAANRNLFAGISVPSGSDARRPTLATNDNDFQRQLALATRQKNFRGIAQKMLNEPQRGAQLIAEIRREFRDLPNDQAALQIVHLANDYRRRQQWDLAEAAMIEVIELFPEEPVAAEAMLWLTHLWSSDEMAWQRSRGVQLDARQQATSRQAISGRVDRMLAATRRLQDDPVRLARELADDPLPGPDQVSRLPQQDSRVWQQAAMTFWQRQALQMGRLMRKRIPQAYRTHEVTWPLASVLRRQGYAQPAATIYRRLMTLDTDDPIGRLANGELWLSNPADQNPPHLSSATWAQTRPFLDGSLDDECWRDAREIRLTSTSRSATGQVAGVRTRDAYAFAQIANDDQFLFVAASFPRADGVPTDGPQYSGRKHDADLSGFDRVRIELDLDRDYSTAYRIEVDQRGHVSESCWDDAGWNPKLAVAVTGDASHWRLEMAIPFSELTWQPPGRETAWAVSIVRTTPHVGWQSWVHPAGEASQPGSFGLIQFR